jgi:serine/threonine protein kinase
VAWLSKAEAQARCERLLKALSPLMCLRHQNLAAVYEVGLYNNTVYMARALARGVSLRTILEQGGTLSLYQASRMAAQSAEALDTLEAAGMRHGGLNLDNLFVEPDGSVRVTDAAFARSANDFLLAGVTCRAAARATPATDLGTLAAITFRALTGTHPIRRDGSIACGYHLPPEAREALKRALEEGRPRFRSAVEFAAALLPAPPKTLFQLAWKPAAAIGLFGALATVGGVAMPQQARVESHVSRVVGQGAGAGSEEEVPPGNSTTPQLEQAQSSTPDDLAVLGLPEEDTQSVALAIRRQGAAALAHPAIADVFELSEEQRIEVADCLTEQRIRVERLVNFLAEGGQADSSAAMQTIRDATHARILLLLNDTQRAKWQALLHTRPAPGEPLL